MDIHAALQPHAERLAAADLADLVANADRARLLIEGPRVTLDARKQRLDADALDALYGLVKKAGLELHREALFEGADINVTEGRPALHPALRDPRRLASREAAERLVVARETTRRFAEACRSEPVLDGHPVKRVINIGIGGSNLGPRLVHDTLKAWRSGGIELRFVSNLDPADLDDALEGAAPEKTLVCVTSKSFTTQETLLNARAAHAWLSKRLGESGANARFAAATANPERARAFGVAPERIFAFADGVGGRFSLWSAAGVCLEIVLGPEVFDRLLAGAAEMDAHFLKARTGENLPVVKALIDVWNRVGLQRPSRCVAVYSTRMERLPAYLQQLEMESLGKAVDREGRPLSACGALVWGGRGADVQHSVFQWLHQGLDPTPVDFIAAADTARGGEREAALIANMTAQGAALLKGRGEDAETDAHRAMPGGRASSTLLMEALSPEALGALLALHEHKVFVESLIYGLNPFDQWGVELGKTLAKSLLSHNLADIDPATRDLARRLGLSARS